MSYFRELPDILYQSNLLHKVSSQEYIRIKNIFRRVKLKDWIQDNARFFNKYTIRDGERPDTMAERLYGTPDRDWIIVLTAGITNIKDEWPLSNYDLYRYVENKYGNDLNAIHHYETIEVRDNRGRLILPGGQRVDQNFTIPTPYDASETNFYVGVRPQSDNISYKSVNSDISPITGISNYEYETQLNENKRRIEVMKPSYLQQFLNDMRELMNYKESSQTVNSKLLTTENTRLIGP
jgi:hypothetical protein|tara:strand:+ start:175 stop:885 length:711 start_codon:yes stop_codon:yes gene_type:complete